MKSLIPFIVILLLAGCASRPEPLPREYAWSLPWGAIDPETGATVGISDELTNAGRNRLPEDTDQDGRSNYAVLIISGGGAKGAFGAGVLKGWTEAGSRPEFRLVTGVSTGALMATWAFLGPRYDSDLERFYTQTTDAQVFKKRNPLLQPFHASLLDTAPLRKTIAVAVDERLLAEDAREYRQGRRLYVASTDLDQGRLVVWDLGAIAASGRYDKLDQYRYALLASAAIPVGFPPVYFPVEVGDKVYSQMHVDGGAIANLFMTRFIIDQQRALTPPDIDRTQVEVYIYLLVNSHLGAAL